MHTVYAVLPTSSRGGLPTDRAIEEPDVRSVLLRLGVGDPRNDADLLDDTGCRVIAQVRQDLYPAAELLHHGSLGQSRASVIAALDEHVGPNRAYKLDWRFLIERDQLVDTAERRQHLRAIFERVDWALWAFEACHAGVGVDSDDQDIAKRLSPVEIGDVAAMQNVEAAVGEHDPAAFMPFETFTRLVDEFGPIEQLHLQGLGEPVMHPRFFDMVAYASARGIRVTTNSNLTLLNARRAERCVTSGLDCLHVSIDGAEAATYERIRVRSHFEPVVRNLQLLRETRQRLESSLPHLKLVVVIMRQNLHELPDLVRLAHSWQMEEIWVQHLCHDFGEATLPPQYKSMRTFIDSQTLLNEDPERIEQYFGAARTAAHELGIKLRLPRTRRGRTR